MHRQIAALIVGTAVLTVPALAQVKPMTPEELDRARAVAAELGVEAHDRVWWAEQRRQAWLNDQVHAPIPGMIRFKVENKWPLVVSNVAMLRQVVNEYPRVRAIERLGHVAASGEDRWSGSDLLYHASRNTGELSPEDEALAEDLVVYLEEGFDWAFDMVVEAEQYLPVHPVALSLESHLMPYLGDSRAAARTGVSLAWHAWRAGEHETSVDRLEAVLGLERFVCSDPWLISQLTGIAIRSLAIGSIQELALEHGCPPELAERLIRIMQLNPSPSPVPALGTERMLIRAELDMLTLEAISNIPAGQDPETMLRTYFAIQGLAGHDEQSELIDEWFELAVEACAAPTAEHTAIFGRIDLASRALGRKHRTLELMAPAIEQTAGTFAHLRTQESGVQATLALIRHHAEHDAWPDSLQDLVPGFLESVPLDHHSGHPLIYRLIDPQADSVQDAVLLYSVGADLTDHGGSIDPKSTNASRNTSRGDFVLVGPDVGN